MHAVFVWVKADNRPCLNSSMSEHMENPGESSFSYQHKSGSSEPELRFKNTVPGGGTGEKQLQKWIPLALSETIKSLASGVASGTISSERYLDFKLLTKKCTFFLFSWKHKKPLRQSGKGMVSDLLLYDGLDITHSGGPCLKCLFCCSVECVQRNIRTTLCKLISCGMFGRQKHIRTIKGYTGRDTIETQAKWTVCLLNQASFVL